jgi:hypothetical protein
LVIFSGVCEVGDLLAGQLLLLEGGCDLLDASTGFT